MTADQHEALIRAYIDEVFNGHRVDALEKYWDDDLTSHWLGMETIHGLPAWRAAMGGFFAAFPDAAYTLDDMFFAGDRGVWRGHWQATQQGEWQGIAASGRNVTWTVIIIGRFAGGKLIEDRRHAVLERPQSFQVSFRSALHGTGSNVGTPGFDLQPGETVA